MKSLIPTVNVIEIINGDLQTLLSFPDTEEGNKEAETLFCKLISKASGELLTSDDAEFYLDEGVYDGHGNGKEVLLVHSEMKETI